MEARQDSSSASRESDRSGLALLAVAAAVVTWGWSNVAIKSVSVTGLVASFWRLWIAIPALWLTALAMPAVRRDLAAAVRRGPDSAAQPIRIGVGKVDSQGGVADDGHRQAMGLEE